MNNENIQSEIDKGGLCISHLILVGSIVICSIVSYWLYIDSDVDKLRDYRFGYNRLVTFERFDDVNEFRSETLAAIFDDEIDIIWLPVIRNEPDGYEKLQYYSRLLAGNPDHEVIYKEISEILDTITDEFSVAKRNNYLLSLKLITSVHHQLLGKYNLLTASD